MCRKYFVFNVVDTDYDNDDDDDEMIAYSAVVCIQRSRDKAAIYADSDTEVDYSRRLNLRSTSPSARSEVTQGRSRTLQRPTYTAAAAAAAAGDTPHHHRQTSLPSHSTSVGLFTLSSQTGARE